MDFSQLEMHFVSWNNPAKLCWSRLNLLGLKSTDFNSSLGSSRDVPLLPFPPGNTDNKKKWDFPGFSSFPPDFFLGFLFCLVNQRRQKIQQNSSEGRRGRGGHSNSGAVNFSLIIRISLLWRPSWLWELSQSNFFLSAARILSLSPSQGRVSPGFQQGRTSLHCCKMFPSLLLSTWEQQKSLYCLKDGN